ncbi:MAG: adenosylcobinamide-GDP ribazoletransferase [Candidatus Pacebacteria bacterium]|nr:adenosylcobinamide-GDP ribazoletransferase [Candidatus Paceibacterota bacterium]
MIRDLLASIGFFTRFPLPAWLIGDRVALGFSGRAYWAVPLVGLGIGAVSGGVFVLAHWLNLPPLLAAILAVVAGLIITGAIHEDGLADCADGLGIRGDQARVLAKMREPTIGVFGTLALVVTILWRVLALSLLPPLTGVYALIMVGGMARVGMAALTRQPFASSSGLHHQSGSPSPLIYGLTLGQGVLLGWLGLGLGLWTPLSLVIMIVILGLGLILIARTASRKIGGINGDYLGGSEQFCELVILSVILQSVRLMP